MNYCPSCGTAINGSAFCSKCGSGKTVTVEATGKKWKRMQLASVLILLLGIFSCAATIGDVRSGLDHNFTPQLLMLGGLIGVISARVGAWWHHG